MANLNEVKRHAENLIEQYLPGRGWTVKFDNAKRRLGCCIYSTRQISLSRGYMLANTLEQMDDVIRHEIAHAIAGGAAGHGAGWVAACRITGARAERCHNSDQHGTVVPPSAWLLVCPKCGKSSPRHRRTATVYICRRDRSVLEWHRGGRGIVVAPEVKVPTPAERVAEVTERVTLRWGA